MKIGRYELVRVRAELAQVRRELHDERVRRNEWERMYNQAVAGTGDEELKRQLEEMKASRDFWLNRTVDAICERDEIRQIAQEQSDCEAEGLKRQLEKVQMERNHWRGVARQERAWVRKEQGRSAKAEAQLAAVKEAVEWLWGFWDGNTLIARSSGYEEDIGAAWDKLLEASGAFSKSRKRPTEQCARN